MLGVVYLQIKKMKWKLLVAFLSMMWRTSRYLILWSNIVYYKYVLIEKILFSKCIIDSIMGNVIVDFTCYVKKKLAFCLEKVELYIILGGK